MFEFLYYGGYNLYGLGGYGSFDSSYLIFMILIAAVGILSAAASAKVKSTYNEYKLVNNSVGMTGAQAARKILDSRGLYHVGIVCISGQLTDNYNPSNNVVSLSQEVYNGSSIAAVGIAAHEVGHAIQHNENYLPVRLRSALVPIANFGSRFSWLLIVAGLGMMGFASGSGDFGYFVAVAGVVLFAASTLFYLVTYPVETNASSRALKQLQSVVMLPETDIRGVKKVLRAAAMTYLAALLNSLVYLFRYISLVSRRRDNDR